MKNSFPQCTAASHMAFLLLSLLLVFSGCAGTTVEVPSRYGRQVQQVEHGSPLSAAAIHQFPSHIKGGGSLRVDSVYAEGGYVHRVNENLQIGVAGNYDFSDYNFSDLNFYSPRPWSEVHMIGAAIPILYNVSDRWTLIVVPVGQTAFEPGADFARSLSYGGAIGAAYKFGPGRTIGLGAGGIYNLAQTSFFPFIVINWKFNDQWTLQTPYRAGPTGPAGIELAYAPLKCLEFGVGASYQSKRFRLSHTNLTPNGIGEYDTLPLYARVSVNVLPHVNVNGYGGFSPYNYVRLEDSRGGRLYHSHQFLFPFVGGGLSLEF